MMKFSSSSLSYSADKLGAGGPDTFGYIYVDSDTSAPNAPTFNWIDISGSGTLVTGLGDDNVVGPFPVGFNFPYYWYQVNSFYVGSNGYIGFGDNTLCASPFPVIPNSARPNNMLAPLLSDLTFLVGTPSCYYWTNAANDTCVITYQNLQWWNMPASNCSLQIILAKPDSSITFQYKRIIGTPNGGWQGASSGNRTGIENFIGNVGLQYSSGTGAQLNDIHDNLAVKFYPPATTSYEARDLSIWDAMNDISGGFFAYRDSAKTLWTHVKNSGTVTLTSCSLYCRVLNEANDVVYSDIIEVASMTAGQTQLVEFDPAWTPTVNGLYRTIIKAYVTGDIFRGNDSVVIETHVVTYPVEMSYDDDDLNSSSSWSGSSGGYGTKFTPPKYPCIITGAKVKLSINVTNPVECTIYVFRDDSPGGSPGTVLAKRGVVVSSNIAKWYRVFLTDTIYNGSFVVGVTQNDSGLTYGMDTDAPISGQVWEYTGVWAPYRDKGADDVMFRALVGFTPLEYDATTLEITAPLSMVTPGATITPRALIGNYGTLDQSNIPVTMKIDSSGVNVYTGTATISLNGAEENYTDFTPQWTAGPSGVGYDMMVYTSLTNDQDQTNDTIKGVTSAFTVTTILRGKFAAVNPTIDGSVDEFEWSDANKYDVSDMLGAGNGTPHKAGSAFLWVKHDTNFVYVATTMPNDASADNGDQLGLYIDEDRSGTWAADSSEGNYWLINYDTGGLDSVIYRAWLPTSPDPTTWRYGPVPGSQIICSQSNGCMNFEAAIPKGSEKSQMYFRPHLNADTMRFWFFALDNQNGDYNGWWPQNMSGGSWQNPFSYGYLIFQPPLYDVGVSEIIQPTGSVVAYSTVIPKVVVKNYGLATTTFPVIFTITEQKSDYVDTAWVSLSGMQTDTVEFQPWQANTINIFATEARVAMPGDMSSGNNTLLGSFEVLRGMWTRLDDIATGKYIKDGGALVAVPDGKTDALYAFRGTKSNEVYKYSGGVWTLSDSLKFGLKFRIPLDTTKFYKKFPGKGAALCYDDANTIYATRGNGVKEWWSYNLTTGVWTQESFVPVPKSLKGGTSIKYYDGKVYLLAGAQKKTDANNFFVFDTATRLWTTGGALGLGSNQKVWKDGSSISILNGTIYALKGGDKNNLFYAYDFGTSTWAIQETMPIWDSLYGKYKKKLLVKDGGATAASDNAIYAIKGGGTNVFWMYTPGTPGVWSMMAKESIPRPTKKSTPKTGAAMAYLNGAIYLLKGNKTGEFWRYSPASDKFESNTPNSSSTITSVMTEKTLPTLRFNFDVNPNPFTKLTNIRYTVPISGNVSIKLYNSSGRLVQTLVNNNLDAGTYSSNLSAKNLANGIYFVQYEDGANKREIKLVVQ
jgi:hypothetical protein